MQSPQLLVREGQVFGEVLGACMGGKALAGSCLWMTAAISYPDYDGFTIYFDPRARGEHGELVSMVVGEHVLHVV